ncbi:MAG: threonine--tRNA ligase [Candidatus Doudnabacteria bacterium]|nr:threonine--tRNA ligase [Candidatus Doudnabacteria bacterium]
MQEHNHEHLDNLRHSAAHLLAAAVMKMWPNTKRAIGPAIEDGFYFDFEFENPISEKDFPKIEKTMKELVKHWKGFERHELSAEDAKKEYPSNQYKHELIDEFSGKGETLSFYKSGEYWDLCRGGHVEDPKKELQHFKLLSVAGAYWRGSEKNPMLTRIYGTAFPTKEELEEHLNRLEEAKKRDHKKLGKELDLFVFSDMVGKGLPLFTPKGSAIRRELERFVVDEEIKRGYQHVYTPDIAKLDLYKKSGHYPYYKDSMYSPIKIEDEEFMLRPMSCPHHYELYLSKPHSYRELPIRIAELAKLYRFEQSGELTGLQRVRTFCLADAHIFARKDQAESEIAQALDLIEYLCSTLGLKLGEDYRYRLSLGDRQDEKKYFKDDKSWNHAEKALRNVLTKRQAPYFEAENEAAFYGPKIDIQMKNVNDKEDTAFTVQYDFVMPKRFELNFTNESGEDEEPIVIHRSSIGAFERSIAFLIEKYAGAFPVWLSPVQAKILPISDKFNDYAKNVFDQLRENNIRVELDDRSESVGKKIREAEMEKVPYMLIVGEKEVEAKSVSVRARNQKDLGTLDLDNFIKQIIDEIKNRS